MRREVYPWDWYDWDTLTQTCTDMTGMTHSHIRESLGQGISVLSVSMVSLTSQSYHCKLWFQRLNRFSLRGTPRVSLIWYESYRSFWCSHIRLILLGTPWNLWSRRASPIELSKTYLGIFVRRHPRKNSKLYISLNIIYFDRKIYRWNSLLYNS